MLDVSENNKIIKMVQTLLHGSQLTGGVTPEEILMKLNLVIALQPSWEKADTEFLVDELVRRNSISSGDFRKLQNNENHEPWYSKDEKQTRPYWERYRWLLEESMPWSAIDKIDEMTDSVMSDIENPLRSGGWDRRGLVVGHVQSGKTSNYTGLICKAADAGYKIIIVLAGLHNNLRAQTQTRLDEGFLGYETNPSSSHPDLGAMRKIGVGRIDGDAKLRPQWVTTRLESGDFKAAVAQNLGVTPEERPWLFVIKKQKTVLTSLLKWLNEHVADSIHESSGQKRISHLPLLMIDDEADNASVDTGEQSYDSNGEPDLQHEPKTINRLIRQIINLFNRKAYVGYTATPFANIFIHEKGRTLKEGPDLFPSAFVYNIPAPSNYIGPAKVFGTKSEYGRDNALPLTSIVEDHTDESGIRGWIPDKHNKNHVPIYENEPNLPPSLLDALDSFILACAVRNVRGMERKHSSMLIHVTRFQDVQNRLKETVELYIQGLNQRFKRGIGEREIVDRLKELWTRRFVPTTTEINGMEMFDSLPINDWSEILSQIPTVLEDIQVKAVNGSAKDALDYVDSVDPKRVIAIGGDKLARGLTLEGLVTSYFLRASKMYDTLMQMGRWFGYRDGYIDLCRLYTTADLIEWFEHITDAAEELRDEFDFMVQTGATPREYGLKVLSHPTLLVTSRIKMRNAQEMQLSFSGESVETVAYQTALDKIKSNFNTFTKLTQNIGSGYRANPLKVKDVEVNWNAYRWDGVPADNVLEFLEGYSSHEKSYKANPEIIRSFISEMNNIGELRTWNIALLCGSSKSKTSIGFLEATHVIRSPRNSTVDRFSIGRLLSPKDEAIDLNVDEWTHSLEKTQGTNEAASVPTGPNIRAVKSLFRGASAEGLLLVYLIDSSVAAPDSVLPFVGFGMSFPASKSGTKVKYVVNVTGQEDYV